MPFGRRASSLSLKLLLNSGSGGRTGCFCFVLAARTVAAHRDLARATQVFCKPLEPMNACAWVMQRAMLRHRNALLIVYNCTVELKKLQL
jgi:hypothetical protein